MALVIAVFVDTEDILPIALSVSDALLVDVWLAVNVDTEDALDEPVEELVA